MQRMCGAQLQIADEHVAGGHGGHVERLMCPIGCISTAPVKPPGRNPMDIRVYAGRLCGFNRLHAHVSASHHNINLLCQNLCQLQITNPGIK